jgi:hypothetical protein
MSFKNIIFKEYLNLVYKNGQNYYITPFFDGFFYPFSDIDPDPKPSSYGSGKSSGSLRIRIHNTSYQRNPEKCMDFCQGNWGSILKIDPVGENFPPKFPPQYTVYR